MDEDFDASLQLVAEWPQHVLWRSRVVGRVLSVYLTLAGSGADVGDETSPAGVWLGRALLAGVAPRSANRSAAQGFGADDAAELALAHLVVHLCETWPSPVVCGGGGTQE